MSKFSITLSKPVPLTAAEDAAKLASLHLADMTAGDYFDAAREAPENASSAELEARVAAKCADLGFDVIRRLSMPDYAKVSAWYDAQWGLKAAAGPLPDGAKPVS